MAEDGFRTFFHVNEFGIDGWKHLPAMCALSEAVTLWAPSGKVLREAYETGQSRLSPSDVLMLLKEGNLKIAGRESWFLDKQGRKNIGPHDYPGRAWLDGFDDEIADMAYQSKDSTKGPVRICGPERGKTDAKDLFDRDPAIVKRVEGLLRPGRQDALPPGTRERVQRIQHSNSSDKDRKSIEVVLRDSINHADAKKFSGSNISMEKGREAIIAFLQLGEKETPTMMAPDQPVTDRGVDRALDVLTELSQFSDVKSLIEIVRDTRSGQQLYEIIAAERYAARRIAKQIKDGVQPESFSAILGDYQEWLSCDIGSLLVSILSWYGGGRDSVNAARKARTGVQKISRREMLRQFALGVAAGGTTTISVLGTLSSPLEWVLEKTSMVGDKHFYSGPTYPFLLAYDTDDPTRQQIAEMLNKLGKIS